MGGLSTFCGLHARVYGEDRLVVHGYFDELLDRMTAMDGVNDPTSRSTTESRLSRTTSPS